MVTKKKRKPRPRAKERACDLAIKKTVAYSSVFKYPMSFFQLSTYLITKQEYDYDFFSKSVRRLVKKKHIKAVDGKFHHSSVKPLSWKLRHKNTEDLKEEVEKHLKIFESMLWIRMLAITGSVAANNAKKDDDIDLFIITEKNRLWLTRGFTWLMLKIFNKFANGHNDNRKFCCNLYLDESRLEWDKDKQNVYVAREIIGMHPIINRGDTYFRFFKENRWIHKHFRHFNIHQPEKFKPRRLRKSKVIDWLEKLAHNAQLNFMKNKKTTEITKKDFIHFNKHDHTNNILKEFESLVKST